MDSSAVLDRPPVWRTRSLLALLAALGLTATACGGDAATGSSGTVVVDIGYQSKTINTVTAGTLLRDQGIFEAKLKKIGEEKGVRYKVEWHDFPSGPPLTAQMIAGKVDIGSMGDYPLLVNGSKSAEHADAKSEFTAVTGYNLRGSLNQVVVPPDSPARTLADLRGRTISTSVGSAAHGMLVNALREQGMDPKKDVRILNQEPSVGASALESNQVDAMAQFVPWPQVMTFRDDGRLLYDGGENGVATFHAVVSRQAYAKEHPEVMRAFLESMKDSTDYLNKNPLAAAQKVAKTTGLAPEVVYLYNGPGGMVSFDPTIKQPQVDALKADLPFLKDLGAVKDLDLKKFVNDSYLRKVYGPDYDSARDSTDHPSAITGKDAACDTAVDDPATASEVWFAKEKATKVAATPTCLLRQIAAHDGEVRAAYVPDTRTGNRMFAPTATWVLDKSKARTAQLLPFAAPADADAYLKKHQDAREVDYEAALDAA